MSKLSVQTFFAAGLFAASCVLGAAAQELPMEGPVPTSTVIRVDPKGNTAVSPATLKLEVNGRTTPIDSVRPVAPQGAEIAILIDDGLRMSFSTQLRDMESFITSLPAGTRVMVGYMQNGTVRQAQEGGFTADHGTAAAALRMPLSSPGVSASPYFCLSEFVKHWPSNEHAARFVLMITNGVDPYNGRPSVMNQDSPYVQQAQDDAQRAGVVVYPLYFGDAGMRGMGANFSGQSYLSQVAEATGGESLYNGTFSPVNLNPYLDRFKADIRESFVLSFKANAGNEHNDTLRSLRVRSTNGAKVHAPAGVHPGNTEG